MRLLEAKDDEARFAGSRMLVTEESAISESDLAALLRNQFPHRTLRPLEFIELFAEYVVRKGS